MICVARPALEWRPGRIITGDSSGPIAPPSDTPRLVPKGRRNDQPKIVLALVLIGNKHSCDFRRSRCSPSKCPLPDMNEMLHTSLKHA